MKYTFTSINTCPICNSSNLKLMGKRLNKSQGLTPKKKVGISVSIQKCKNCNLIYPNPLPIPNSLQDHYGIPPESYWKPEYFNVPENHLEELITWMNNIAAVPKGSKILDIGAGIGKAMIAFEKKGYDVYGIEPSEPFYSRAIEKMGIAEEKLKLTSVEDCTYEENSFDVILFSAVLEHLYDPNFVLKHVLSWLKPNGLLFIEVPSSKWLVNKFINTIYKFSGTDYVANLSPMHEPFHLYEFSKKTFEIHAKSNNYTIADSKYYICETFLPKFLDPVLKPVMKFSNTGMELAIWLRKN